MDIPRLEGMMKPTLALMALLFLGFILWLGRPYEFKEYPACDSPNITHRNSLIDEKLLNCGPPDSFLERINLNWIKLAVHGNPIIANLHLSHNKNCSNTAIDGAAGTVYIINDEIDGKNGELCLYLETNK